MESLSLFLSCISLVVAIWLIYLMIDSHQKKLGWPMVITCMAGAVFNFYAFLNIIL